MNSKQKNIALLGGFFFMLLLSYQFAIKNTLYSRKKYRELEKEHDIVNAYGNKISYLKQQNTYLDSILKVNEIYANVSFQQIVLNKVSKYAENHKLKIISFNSPHIFNVKEKEITTYTLEVQGGFSSLLNFVHFFENQRLGSIISVDFLKKKDYRKNKNYLTVKIYLQKNKN